MRQIQSFADPFIYMVTELFLDFPDTTSVKTMRVSDASFYNPKIKVTCARVDVTPPGYLEPITFNVKAGFSIVLNASNLKLAKVKVYKKLQALPDGIYTIKYSINPNDGLWIEYDYLRISKLMEDYNAALLAIKITPYPLSREVQAELKRIREIEWYIKSAKGEVEYKGNRTRGMELYHYAAQLLAEMTKEKCKTC